MILAIANQKGGVGKTTTVANIGWLLASEHRLRTALLDLNAQRASLRQILEHDPPGATLCDWLAEGADAGDALAPVNQDLWLMEGSRDLASKGRQLLGPDLEVLSRRIRATLSDFDAIVLDTPPELGELVLSALHAATDVLVVTEALSQSLAGLVDLVRIVDAVRERGGGEEPRLAGILPTMVDIGRFAKPRSRHQREVIAELQRVYGDAVLSFVRRSIAVADADVMRLPIVVTEPNHPISQAYRDVTAAILARAGG